LAKDSENRSPLESQYSDRFKSALRPLAVAIEAQLKGYFLEMPRIDRIVARAKSINRFLQKAGIIQDGRLKYSDPLFQIQDQLGARIVVFYLSDVPRVSAIIERYYRSIESRSVVPDSESEFGYFGKHYVLLVPSGLVIPPPGKDDAPEFFELQIKTLFQHAWSEANHDIGYKPGAGPLSGDATRFFAYASAQAWGADRIFDELFQGRKT
jgi:putative GTP pyrophosphokinase